MSKRHNRALQRQRQSNVAKVAPSSISAQTITITTTELPIPPNSFHAETISISRRGNLCRLAFAQFRFGSLKLLKSVVCIDMPISKLLLFKPSLTETFMAALEVAVASSGGVIPFPETNDEPPINSICYTAHIVKFLVNQDGEGALDFYQIPINFQSSSTQAQIVDVLRITCTGATVDQLVQYVQQLP